jgi:hypothetical protein
MCVKGRDLRDKMGDELECRLGVGLSVCIKEKVPKYFGTLIFSA